MTHLGDTPKTCSSTVKDWEELQIMIRVISSACRTQSSVLPMGTWGYLDWSNPQMHRAEKIFILFGLYKLGLRT